MKPSTTFRILWLSASMALAGCSTRSSDYAGRSFWIYIPLTSLDQARGYPAKVSLPVQTYTTNRMQVRIVGEVSSPGQVQVPEGCTVLQAIGYAGGFRDFAGTTRLHLRCTAGRNATLYLKSKLLKRSMCREVYYEIEPLGNPITESSPWSAGKTDFVLEPGDEIVVGKVTF